MSSNWPDLSAHRKAASPTRPRKIAIAVVSVPMLLDREINTMSAIGASIEAVRRNVGPMIVWAALIALFTVAGLTTFYVGLAVTLPLIGHATWHAYKDLIAQAPKGRRRKAGAGASAKRS